MSTKKLVLTDIALFIIFLAALLGLKFPTPDSGLVVFLKVIVFFSAIGVAWLSSILIAMIPYILDGLKKNKNT